MNIYQKYSIALISSIILFYSCNAISDQNSTHNHHTAIGFQNDPFVQTAAPKGALFYLRRFMDSVFLSDVPHGHILSEEKSRILINTIKGDRITWLGHATFLIRVSGKNILTDPFLTEFASPLSWAGPRRFTPPGISIDKLPQIDIIVVSHSHFDHLDDETVRSLPNKDKINVLVPLGLKSFFTERGYKNVMELDWNNQVTIHEIELTALPSVHDSARSIDDHNKTLWASWSINAPSNKIIFIGDSGYSNIVYNQIGTQYGPFDYAIVPIGAYEPRELMWMSHFNPEEAVMAGIDVGAKNIIASHWGTITLSDEPTWEPPRRFNKSGVEKGYPEKSLWKMKIGETKSL